MKTLNVKLNDILQYTKYIRGNISINKIVFVGQITKIYDDSFRFNIIKEIQYNKKIIVNEFTDRVAGTIHFPSKSTKFKKCNEKLEYNIQSGVIQ